MQSKILDLLMLDILDVKLNKGRVRADFEDYRVIIDTKSNCVSIWDYSTSGYDKIELKNCSAFIGACLLDKIAKSAKLPKISKKELEANRSVTDIYHLVDCGHLLKNLYRKVRANPTMYSKSGNDDTSKGIQIYRLYLPDGRMITFMKYNSAKTFDVGCTIVLPGHHTGIKYTGSSLQSLRFFNKWVQKLIHNPKLYRQIK